MKKLEQSIASIGSPDSALYEAALKRLADQARPAGSLGILEDASARLASIAGSLDVHLTNKFLVTCAGDHGVVEEGVSLFPQEVTPQMVDNFVNDGASINVLARHAGASIKAADIGVNFDFDPALPIFHKKVRKGTANFTKGPAMTREDAVASINAGISIVDELVEEQRIDLLGTGDMGIGNTTPSAAIIAAFSGIDPKKLTDRGTGIDDAMLANKIRVIRKGLEVNRPDPKDPIDVLAKVGGLEIGGLAGLVIGARRPRDPRGVRRFHLNGRSPDRMRTCTRCEGVPICKPPLHRNWPQVHARAAEPDPRFLILASGWGREQGPPLYLNSSMHRQEYLPTSRPLKRLPSETQNR